MKYAKSVSTHSRLKAAGISSGGIRKSEYVSTHSRLKAAGPQEAAASQPQMVSTHSRLKAAGFCFRFILFSFTFQHTAA